MKKRHEGAYLREGGLAVPGSEHDVLHGRGRRVTTALRRALPQPWALSSAREAGTQRGVENRKRGRGEQNKIEKKTEQGRDERDGESRLNAINPEHRSSF